MPYSISPATPAAESLWEALRTKDYTSAKKVIMDNLTEDLVNSTNSAVGSVISMCCVSKNISPELLDFIKFIAPRVDISKGIPKKSSVRSIVLIGHEEVFKQFEARLEILFNYDELSYSFAKETFRTPNYVLNKLQELTIQHRETIIRMAVNTDNPTLLEQLEKDVGINLSDPLSDGIRPARLPLKDSKTREWFNKRLERNLTTLTSETSKNLHALSMWKDKDKALQDLTNKHYKGQAAHYAASAKQTEDELNNAMSGLAFN